MRITKFGIGTLLMAALVVGASAQTTMDPAFRVININGDCKIALPDGGELTPAEESKAYPYGSTIRTGSRSSLVVVISEGNIVRVLANANLVFKQDSSDPKIKAINLEDGEVDIELKKNFSEDGSKLTVETATAICGAVGTKFRVASRMEQDMRIIIFRVIEGIIRVYGENFEAAALDANDWLSLLSPADRSYLRLKTMKGAFDIRIKDQDMNDKILSTLEGTVLKIWQRSVPETNERIVTLQLNSPTGELIETITVTYGAGKLPEFGDKPNGWPQPLPEKSNPLPPDGFMDELIDRTLGEENVEHTVTVRPQPPTPTPVGGR